MEKSKRVSQLERMLSPADCSLHLREARPLKPGDPSKSRDTQSGKSPFVREAQEERDHLCTFPTDNPLPGNCDTRGKGDRNVGKEETTSVGKPVWSLACGKPRYSPLYVSHSVTSELLQRASLGQTGG